VNRTLEYVTVSYLVGTGVAQSVQCLATNWSRFDPRQRQEIFSLTSVSRPAVGLTQPPFHWVPRSPIPGGKARPGRDADYSPPCRAEVVNE
jgi:hypothetical protein